LTAIASYGLQNSGQQQSHSLKMTGLSGQFGQHAASHLRSCTRTTREKGWQQLYLLIIAVFEELPSFLACTTGNICMFSGRPQNWRVTARWQRTIPGGLGRADPHCFWLFSNLAGLVVGTIRQGMALSRSGQPIFEWQYCSRLDVLCKRTGCVRCIGCL
jgi:hypothetical protein